MCVNGPLCVQIHRSNPVPGSVREYALRAAGGGGSSPLLPVFMFRVWEFCGHKETFRAHKETLRARTERTGSTPLMVALFQLNLRDPNPALSHDILFWSSLTKLTHQNVHKKTVCNISTLF